MAALCIFLTAACGFDYKENRIPNVLIGLMMILGAVWRFWNGESWNRLSYPVQAAAVMLLFYPFFKIGGLGAGDVKLLGASAGYLPLGKIPAFLFCSLLAAAVLSLAKMWKGKDFGDRMRYLWGYLSETVQRGSWQLYLENEREERSVGVCLSGPVFFSVLLYLGGVY